MNILKLIIDNLRKGTVSYKLPHKHECTSESYRGLIQNDATRCIGCGACAYVCPTGAIEVKRSGETYTWDYDPGKCTFCVRCIDRCRPNTLTSESKLPPLYADKGELAVHYEMQKKKPAPRPAPAAAAVAAAPASPVAAVVAAAAEARATVVDAKPAAEAKPAAPSANAEPATNPA